MISQEERERREFVINFARGSVYFEGCVLSEEMEKINQRYINGEIDISEHTKLCLAQAEKEENK